LSRDCGRRIGYPSAIESRGKSLMIARRPLLTLCWLWLALIACYLLWGGIAQAGLYYWVGTIEIDWIGGYESMLTGLLPGILLGLPALWIVGRDARRSRLAPPDLTVGARSARLVAFVLFGLGFAALAAAIVCFLLALGLPAGTERAMPFDAATLGAGPAPAGKVRFTGTADANARTFVSGGARFDRSTTTYAGFRAAGEANEGAPFRLFLEHWSPGNFRQAVLHAGAEQSGYLIEDGLPPLVRYTLEHQGVRIASPHYLLLTSSGGLRQPYYVGAGVGVFSGWVLIGIGVLLLVLPKRGRLRSVNADGE
jgi:hypothetical protein